MLSYWDFDKFNTDKALCIYGTILIVFRNSLNRTSALGVDGETAVSSLSLREVSCSPSLVYKTSILDVLQRPVFILVICFRLCRPLVLALG